MWDTQTGEPVGPPLQHHYYVMTLDFAPDGNALATGGFSGTVQVWRVSAPMAGEVSQIALWTNVVSGMKLDERGSVHALDEESSNQLRRQIKTSAGLQLQSP